MRDSDSASVDGTSLGQNDAVPEGRLLSGPLDEGAFWRP